MKYKIVIIGAGRVAYSLTAALIKSGYNVISVISRNKKSAELLAERFKIENHSDNFLDIPKSTTLILLTVPDDQIEAVAKNLSKQNLNFKNLLVVHLSGSKNIHVLRSLKRKGATTASMHIMKAFGSKRVLNLRNAPAAIESGSDAEYKLMKKVAMDLNLIPFKIDSKLKQFYHLVGVFSLNFLVGNLHSVKKLLELHKIDELEYLKSLHLVVNSVSDDVSKTGSANVLSGPVERGDYKTVSKHIDELRKLCNKRNGSYFRSMLRNYVIQSLNLLYVTKEKFGFLSESHLKVEKILNEELKTFGKSK